MKTQFLLIAFLCIFSFSVCAQAPNQKDYVHYCLHRIDPCFHQPGSGGLLHPNGFPNYKTHMINNVARLGVNQKENLNQSEYSYYPIIGTPQRNLDKSTRYQWKWDTIVCFDTIHGVPFQRVSRKYNTSGDSIIQLTERRQDGFLWENFARETFNYDSSGNLLTYFSEKWINNVWENFGKRDYVYTTNGDPLDRKFSSWQSNAWVDYDHYKWHYNASGLYDTCMYQTGQGGILVNSKLWIPTYDGNGDNTMDIEYNWTNNNWVYSYQETYTNDSNGHHLTGLRQDWVNSSWVNSMYYFWTWDAAGNWLSALRQEWQSNAWVNVELMTNVYDGNENIINNLDQNWVNGNWVNFYQILCVYDTSNNMLSRTDQNWDTSYWLNTTIQQYTYDSMGNSLTGKVLMWQLNGWIPYDGTPQVFADHQPDYTVNLLGVYRYYTIIDSILVFTEPTAAPLRVSLFPNPAHSKLYVSLPRASIEPSISMAIYNLYGQLVLSKKLVYETTDIDISGLKPGVYFMRFNNRLMTRVLKFIKE